jgi:hypothetical protein
VTAVQHLHLHLELPREVGPRLGTGIELDEVEVRQPDGELVTGLNFPDSAYLLVGDGVALLTKDQRELLAHTASVMTGQAVRVVAMNATDATKSWLRDRAHVAPLVPTEPEPDVKPAPGPERKHEVEPVGSESEADPDVAPGIEREPIPISKNDFRHFGREYGYAKTRAGRVWNRVFYTAREDNGSKEDHGLPAIRYVGVVGHPHPYKRDESILDLRSVYERLVASGWRPEAWDGATKADIAFLIHLVEAWGVVEVGVVPVGLGWRR